MLPGCSPENFSSLGRPDPRTVAEQQNPSVAATYAVLNQFSPTTIPDLSGVPLTQQIVWEKDPNIQNPTVFATGIQVERQLPRNITMFAGFYNIRIVHVIRARDVNAPSPGTRDRIQADLRRAEFLQLDAER